MESYRFTPEQQFIMEKSKIPYAVYQFIDKRLVTLAISDGFCDLFGFEDRKQAYYIMENDMYRDTHPDDKARIANAALHFAAEGGSYDVVYRSKAKSGGYMVVHANGEEMYTSTGLRLAMVWYTNEGPYIEGMGIDNVTLNKALTNALHEESILNASYYDYLTGLPSMTYFFELAAGRREHILAEGKTPTMLFIDFSGMKFYNSRHGFAEGDKLLREFAKTLVSLFANENCSRFGQDHFAVATYSEGLEERLYELFRLSETLNGGKSLPVRVGIYRGGAEKVNVSTACDRAKLACDELDNSHVSCYKYFNAGMLDDANHTNYIIENLDRAIAEKWIKVYYQPIVRAVNGRVCDEEALARWIDPVNGMLSPAEFIPALEESGLIYKLDLYMLDQVLEKLKVQKAAGLHLVPQSINLSRSDFDACDIVEEIRRRVDSSGLGRDKITIEITESIIGSDFNFMSAKIGQFRDLGFPVWMDDFGSGYSSLDVLQSIHFNLIKFDMRFMQTFNEGDSGKIILTELMKMANALGVDTICEGVETAEQVRFLQEIGCSKLQGYYYAKPMPLEQILERYEKGIQIGFENPTESAYYEAIGRVNLHDLTVIAQEDENAFQNFFNILPMAIIEVKDERARIVRSNSSYREFMRRSFGINISGHVVDYSDNKYSAGSSFMKLMKQCCHNGNRAFFDETLADGAKVHSFAKRISINPVTGTVAVVIVVLSIMKPDEGASYAYIARALAADYFNLFYVNIDTEKFIEYSSDVGREELAMERHGNDFFKQARRDAMFLLYPEDREPFVAAFTKENILSKLEEQGTFTLTYRLYNDGNPIFVSMKIMRMLEDSRHLIMGVSNVDTQMKQKELLDRIHESEVAYSRIMALSGSYICLYTVDVESDRYVEYNSTPGYKGLGFARQGENFFEDCVKNGKAVVCKDDLPMYLESVTKENIIKHIRKNGIYELEYRLLIDGKPQDVKLKAALVNENGLDRLVIGVKLK